MIESYEIHCERLSSFTASRREYAAAQCNSCVKFLKSGAVYGAYVILIKFFRLFVAEVVYYTHSCGDSGSICQSRECSHLLDMSDSQFMQQNKTFFELSPKTSYNHGHTPYLWLIQRRKGDKNYSGFYSYDFRCSFIRIIRWRGH